MRSTLYIITFFLFLLPGLAFCRDLPRKERLLYKVSYAQAITLGFADMVIDGDTTDHGTRALVFKSSAWNASWMRSLLKVDIKVESHWDPIKRRSLWHMKDILQNDVVQDLEARFNYQTRKALWKQTGYKKGKDPLPSEGLISEIPLDLQDPLSVAYFARSYPKDGEPGMKFSLVTFDDMKLSSIEMTVHKREEISMNINGKRRNFPTLLVEPKFKGTGLFKRKSTNRKLYMWVHDAPGRQLLRMKAEIAVGSIWMDLIEADPF